MEPNVVEIGVSGSRMAEPPLNGSQNSISTRRPSCPRPCVGAKRNVLDVGAVGEGSAGDTCGNVQDGEMVELPTAGESTGSELVEGDDWAGEVRESARCHDSEERHGCSSSLSSERSSSGMWGREHDRRRVVGRSESAKSSEGRLTYSMGGRGRTGGDDEQAKAEGKTWSSVCLVSLGPSRECCCLPLTLPMSIIEENVGSGGSCEGVSPCLASLLIVLQERTRLILIMAKRQWCCRGWKRMAGMKRMLRTRRTRRQRGRPIELSIYLFESRGDEADNEKVVRRRYGLMYLVATCDDR